MTLAKPPVPSLTFGASRPNDPSRWRLAWAAVVVAGVCGCSSSPPPSPGPASRPASSSGPAPAPSGATSQTSVAANAALQAPVRNWTEYKVRAAHRMVAANPNGTYMGPPQDVLLAIPVLEIELNADGSVRRIDILRRPGQAPDTVQLAMEAVRRSAPFGDVRHLPRPWKFNEVFLFNDDRRFKPRTLDD